MRLKVLYALAFAPLLASCETSMRLPSLGGSAFGSSERISPAPQASRNTPPQIDTAPSARVESAPLAPPPGAAAGAPPDQKDVQIPQQSQSSGLGSGATPGASASSTTPQQTARSEPPSPVKDESNAAPSRGSVTGNWQAREASGSNCRITLSSAPKLDLYGASTSGCQSRDLQRVTAWELRGEEVYLYEPGGAVAARLKARSRSMDGTLAKTGAPVTLSK